MIGFLPNEEDTYFEATLQTESEDAFGQKWCRSSPNSDGWFTLMCCENGEFLTSASSTYLIVAGNSIVIRNKH